jgi:MSHA pilin protein MshC
LKVILPVSNTKGFTLIELITVIIIIGILAASVVPKFFSSSGYEEYTYRSETIALLRATQLRAMQQKNLTNSCHVVTIASKTISDACGHTVQVENNHDVTFSSANATISFDHDGITNCGASCLISINGTKVLEIKIETQGYIHGL